MNAARPASSLKSQRSSPQLNPHVTWALLQHLRWKSPRTDLPLLAEPAWSQFSAKCNVSPYVLADRAILSCIREVPDYVTCNMPKAIRLYWFSDPCCVGLGIFCSLLSEHSVFGRDVRTPMSQWKESPWHLSFSISRLLILGWEI